MKDEATARALYQAPRWLVPGGMLAIEMGLGHYDAVKPLFENAGFRNVSARRDLAGVERIAQGNVP